MSGKSHTQVQVKRIKSYQLQVKNNYSVNTQLYANEDVSIEQDAFDQLSNFLAIKETLAQIWKAEQAGEVKAFWGKKQGLLERVVLTPDFHRGGGIPIGTVAQTKGFVMPQAVGNDICCGMRLLRTDLKHEELQPHLDTLEPILRGIYFEGKRDLPMSPRQREAMLKDGLKGILDTCDDNAKEGLWKLYDPIQQEQDLKRVHFGGSLDAKGIFGFDDYIRSSGQKNGRDAQLGSIGGGNHFVELQTLKEVHQGSTAHFWGLKPDDVTIMVHSGSVGFGHTVGKYFLDRAIDIYPKELKRPKHGFYALPTHGPHAEIAEAYLDAMANAAHFAFANRLFLGLMAVKAISEVIGRKVQASLVYDAPHNLIWQEKKSKANEGDNGFIHRKGACPAYGPEPEFPGPFQYLGQPVIIPGSMGASSYLLEGIGNHEALSSACHGAGRSVSRGKARRISQEQYQRTLKPLRVVTPIDPNDLKLRGRQDIVKKYHDRLKEESPTSYKDIDSVVNTVEEAGIARKVARLWPILTIKG